MLLAALLALAMTAFAGAGMARDGADPAMGRAIDVQVNVGFSETVRIGHWAPVAVTLANQGADLVGRVELDVPAGDDLRSGRFTVTHVQPLELPGGSRKRLRFTAYVERVSAPLELRVMEGERVLARERVDLSSRVTSARLLLVLSRDADLDHLNDPPTDTLRVVYPHPDLLPRRWQGYDGVAAMVLHGVSLERLDEAQHRALEQWLAHGGRLAVSGGPDYTLMGTPRLAALLPARPLGLERVVDAAAEATAFPPGAFDAHRLEVFEGRVLLRTADLPLAVESDRGRGKVLYLAFDVARAPFRGWPGMPSLWLELLRLPAAESLAARLEQPRQDDPVGAFAELVDRRFPPRLVVLLFLGLYVGALLVRPLAAAAADGRRWLAPLIAWARPLLFAVLAWLLFAELLFPRSTGVYVASVIEPHPQGPFADLGTRVGWYANHHGVHRLEYGGVEPAFRPLPGGARTSERPTDWRLAGGARPSALPVSLQGYRMHVLEGDDVVAFDLEARLARRDDGLLLALRNRSARALSAAWLVHEGRVYPLGAVADDADWTRVLSPARPALETGGLPWYEVLRRAGAGGDPQPRRLAHALLRARGWPAPAAGHALLVGLTESPLRLVGASAGWERRSAAVVLLERPVAAPVRGDRGR